MGVQFAVGTRSSRFAEDAEVVEGGDAARTAAGEGVVRRVIPQTAIVNLRAGLAIQIGVAAYHGAMIGQDEGVEINGTGSVVTAQVHHGVAGNGQTAGKRQVIGLERTVDGCIASRQVPPAKTGAGESCVAGQNISVKENA